MTKLSSYFLGPSKHRGLWSSLLARTLFIRYTTMSKREKHQDRKVVEVIRRLPTEPGISKSWENVMSVIVLIVLRSRIITEKRRTHDAWAVPNHSWLPEIFRRRDTSIASGHSRATCYSFVFYKKEFAEAERACLVECRCGEPGMKFRTYFSELRKYGVAV